MGNVMKKIPVLVSKENIKYMTNHNLSYAKVLNHMIEILREKNIDHRVYIQEGNKNEFLQRLSKTNK